MVNYGTQEEAVFSNNCTVTVGGTNVFALGVGVRVEVGNDAVQQSVIGTDKNMIGAGTYTGTITIDQLYSTAEDFISLTELTNGQYPETTIKLAMKDSQSAGTETGTLTVYAYLNKHSFDIKENSFVRHSVSGIITNQTDRVAAEVASS